MKNPKHPSDPGLQAAAEEIKAILKRYNVAGTIVLASGNGHSEYVNWIAEPTWSALTLEGAGIRLRAKVKSAPAETRALERIKLQKTVNALVHLRDVTAMLFGWYDAIIGAASEQLGLDEGIAVHTPRVDEP